MIENDKDLDNILAERQTSSNNVVNFEKKQEPTVENQTKTLVQQGVDAAVMHKLSNDDTVKEKFLQTADKIVDTNLNTIENNASLEEKAAILKNNKDACDLYGIDEKTVPKWVVYCARRVQDFWYAMWLIIGFFTTVPIVFLGKKIRVVIKHTWVAMIIAVIIYAAVVTSPLWLRHLS